MLLGMGRDGSGDWELDMEIYISKSLVQTWLRLLKSLPSKNSLFFVGLVTIKEVSISENHCHKCLTLPLHSVEANIQ